MHLNHPQHDSLLLLILQSCGSEIILMIVIPPSLFRYILGSSSILTLDEKDKSFNPFEASNQLIDNAKESYMQMIEEERRIVRESPDPLKSND